MITKNREKKKEEILCEENVVYCKPHLVWFPYAKKATHTLETVCNKLFRNRKEALSYNTNRIIHEIIIE